jgi:hypothetical protein
MWFSAQSEHINGELGPWLYIRPISESTTLSSVIFGIGCMQPIVLVAG